MMTPSDLNAPPRIIVIGDLHGDIAMLCSCLYMTHIINHQMEWIAEPPNTYVIQMGDQVDSLSRDNQYSWEKLEDSKLIEFTDKLDTIAQKKGGRFLSMIGNHEIMNLQGNFMYVSSHSMSKSGGISGRIQKYKPGGHYAQILAKRNVIQKIGPLLFCHAGLLPHHLDIANNQLEYINTLFHKMAIGTLRHPEEQIKCHELFVSEISLLWNRLYLHQTAEMDQVLNNVLERTHTQHMMIGHNPMPQITPIYNFKLWLTDVGLSRSFANESLEVLEILNGGIPSHENDHRPFRVIRAIKK